MPDDVPKDFSLKTDIDPTREADCTAALQPVFDAIRVVALAEKERRQGGPFCVLVGVSANAEFLVSESLSEVEGDICFQLSFGEVDQSDNQSVPQEHAFGKWLNVRLASVNVDDEIRTLSEAVSRMLSLGTWTGHIDDFDTFWQRCQSHFRDGAVQSAWHLLSGVDWEVEAPWIPPRSSQDLKRSAWYDGRRIEYCPNDADLLLASAEKSLNVRVICRGPESSNNSPPEPQSPGDRNIAAAPVVHADGDTRRRFQLSQPELEILRTLSQSFGKWVAYSDIPVSGDTGQQAIAVLRTAMLIECGHDLPPHDGPDCYPKPNSDGSIGWVAEDGTEQPVEPHAVQLIPHARITLDGLRVLRNHDADVVHPQNSVLETTAKAEAPTGSAESPPLLELPIECLAKKFGDGLTITTAFEDWFEFYRPVATDGTLSIHVDESLEKLRRIKWALDLGQEDKGSFSHWFVNLLRQQGIAIDDWLSEMEGKSSTSKESEEWLRRLVRVLEDARTTMLRGFATPKVPAADVTFLGLRITNMEARIVTRDGYAATVTFTDSPFKFFEKLLRSRERGLTDEKAIDEAGSRGNLRKLRQRISETLSDLDVKVDGNKLIHYQSKP